MRLRGSATGSGTLAEQLAARTGSHPTCRSARVRSSAALCRIAAEADGDTTTPLRLVGHRGSCVRGRWYVKESIRPWPASLTSIRRSVAPTTTNCRDPRSTSFPQPLTGNKMRGKPEKFLPRLAEFLLGAAAMLDADPAAHAYGVMVLAVPGHRLATCLARVETVMCAERQQADDRRTRATAWQTSSAL